MNVVQFPTKPSLRLTKSEYEQFIYLKSQLKNAMTPGEAIWYRNELDSLIALAKIKNV